MIDFVQNYLLPGGNTYEAAENFWPHRPGEAWEYANIGFSLLGVLVEEVAQSDFATYCQNRIFEPLGMSKSGIYLSDIDPSMHVTPYKVSEPGLSELVDGSQPELTEGHQPLCLYSFPTVSDGLVRSNIVDLALFAQEFLQPSGKLLQEATIARMMTPAVEFPFAPDYANGLGFMGDTRQNVWGHDGADPGISTSLSLVLDDGLAIILLANTLAPLDGLTPFLIEIADAL